MNGMNGHLDLLHQAVALLSSGRFAEALPLLADIHADSALHRTHFTCVASRRQPREIQRKR